MLQANHVIYADSEDSEEAIQQAREWLKEHGFTADDVRLARSNGSVIVRMKREMEWPAKP
jgi:nicotinic acid phosphoribosyltransferase